MNWNKTELLALLPRRMRGEHYEDVSEVRLRLGQAPRLMVVGRWRDLEGRVGDEDLRFVLNAASRYSPWTAGSLSEGI